jgi:hypothetical protein
MPFGDGTGPYGNGPIGRGLGPCRAGTADREWIAQRSAWGFRRGRGMGQASLIPSPSPEEEKALLEQRKSWLQSMLDAVTTRLENLNKSNPT